MSQSQAKRRPSHAENVNALFGQFNKAAPVGSAWLSDLHRRALDKEVDWKADAASYLQGLVDAGAMTPEAGANCRTILARRTHDGSSAWRGVLPLAAFLIWTAMVVSWTLISLAQVVDSRLLAAGALLAAILGALWASAQRWSDQRCEPRQGRLQRRLLIAGCMALAPFLVYYIPAGLSSTLQSMSIKQFRADRAAFMTDPQGFALLRKLASEHYGVDVVLGDIELSWALTTVNVPGASVASMLLQPGYCQLNMHRANLLRSSDLGDPLNNNRWVQGVMMHEFAHCLDGSRDMPAFFGQKSLGTRSLAPADAPEAKDLDSFLEASSHEATQLWREAVADIFTIGFWKLTTPPAITGELVSRLQRKRGTSAAHDPWHATGCWLQYANDAAAPATTAEIFEWADRLRASAPCELPRR